MTAKRKVRAATKHAHAKAIGIAELGGYYDVMVSQGMACAICGREPKHGGRRLDIDHDHKTGQVRGLLCPKCNRMLGWARDTPNILFGGFVYLKHGRMAAVGYRDAMKERAR